MSPLGAPSADQFELALAFANVGGSADDGGFDPLRSPGELVGWLTRTALIREGDPAVDPPTGRLLLDEARRLRSDLDQLFDAYANGRNLPALALHGLNRVLGASRTSLHLDAANGQVRLASGQADRSPLGILAPVAVGAAHLLTTAEPSRLRRCAAPDCAAWFLDTSKGRRRRWCSMARCGNRAKAARHRRRVAAGASSS